MLHISLVGLVNVERLLIVRLIISCWNVVSFQAFCSSMVRSAKRGRTYGLKGPKQACPLSKRGNYSTIFSGGTTDPNMRELLELEIERQMHDIVPHFKRVSDDSLWTCVECGNDSSCNLCSQFVDLEDSIWKDMQELVTNIEAKTFNIHSFEAIFHISSPIHLG